MKKITIKGLDGNGIHFFETDHTYIKKMIEQVRIADGANSREYSTILKKNLKRDLRQRYREAITYLNIDKEELDSLLDNIKKNAEKMGFKKRRVNTWDEADRLLKSIDIRKIFNIGVEFKEEFQSSMFIDNGGRERTAYINIVNGEYRYFLKKKEVKVCMNEGKYDRFETSYTIVDFWKILFKKNYYSSIEELCEMFNINLKNCDTKFRKKQMEKFEENMLAISELSSYPNLVRLIYKNSIILKELNLKALIHLQTHVESYEEQTIFFSATRVFVKEMEELGNQIAEDGEEVKVFSSGYVAKLFQLYRVLGLLDVVAVDKVPEKMFLEVTQNKNKNHNDMLFYIIPMYTINTLAKAERIAKKLIKGGFKMESISQKLVCEILGVKFAEKIFANVKERTDKANYIDTVENPQSIAMVEEPKLYGSKKRAVTIQNKKSEEPLPF